MSHRRAQSVLQEGGRVTEGFIKEEGHGHGQAGDGGRTEQERRRGKRAALGKHQETFVRQVWVPGTPLGP